MAVSVQGRILILEGIEKAERNVLPVLNNLLENREMQLEDGRFLMSSERYDVLRQTHSQEDMDRCVCVCVRACVRACVWACGRACGRVGLCAYVRAPIHWAGT